MEESKQNTREVVGRITLEIRNAVNEQSGWKVVGSKPRTKEIVRGRILPYLDGDGTIRAKAITSTATQDFTKIFDISELDEWIRTWLEREFYFMEIQTQAVHIFVRQNRKGSLGVSVKKSTQSRKEIEEHNKAKNYLLSRDSPFLQVLGMTSADGRLFDKAQKKFKQINKFLEILQNLTSGREIRRVMDMGCGKGYLTFAMYELFTKLYDGKAVHITGIEIREELTEKSNDLAHKCGFERLDFVASDIMRADLEGVDLMVALHACDTATDVAIWKGIRAQVDCMVLSPCCHKQIRKQMKIRDEITKHGIYEERTAEMVTDAIRALLLEAHGYQTKIFEFIGSEHTAKNTMLTAVRSKRNEKAQEEIRVLKERYGIEEHYLERLLQSK